MKENARILVVDDEPMVCLALTNWLQEENYLTKAVDSGAEAIAAVREENWASRSSIPSTLTILL